MTRCLVYGANGYTGALIVRACVELGVHPLLTGRNQNALAALGDALSLDTRVITLDDERAMASVLRDVDVVLNAAGPFRVTAPPWVDACLQHRVHYLDIAGEVRTLDALTRRHLEARARGVMLMPAVGFDVVPSDCLSTFVSHRLAAPTRLLIGLSGMQLMSRGSALTLAETLREPLWVRREGRITGRPHGSIAYSFDYGQGPRHSLAASWGDVVTSYFSTGIPNVTTFFEATAAVSLHTALMATWGWAVPWTPWSELVRAVAAQLPAGPAADQRERAGTTIVARVEDERGDSCTARLHLADPYTSTAQIAARVLARVLTGDVEPGFQTAARLYGADFITTIPGVRREVA